MVKGVARPETCVEHGSNRDRTSRFASLAPPPRSAFDWVIVLGLKDDMGPR